MSMVRYSRKELNEKFGEKQDAEIQRLLAKGTVPDVIRIGETWMIS